MSIDAAISRITQIQAMLARVAPPAPTQTRPPAPVSTQLANAQATHRAAPAARGLPPPRRPRPLRDRRVRAPGRHAVRRRDHRRGEGQRRRSRPARRPGQAGVRLQPEAGSRAGARGLTQLMPAHRGRPGRVQQPRPAAERSTAAPSTSGSSSTPSRRLARPWPPTTPVPAPCSASAASRPTPRPRTTSATSSTTPALPGPLSRPPQKI